MKKDYRLIVDSDQVFSIPNDTDADPMSDYSPGIWAVKGQKRILKYAKDIIAAGNNLKVDTYGGARYAKLANRFIDELGLDQPHFTEAEEIPKTISNVTGNLKISNQSQLKKYLAPGVKVRSIQFSYVHGEVKRDTFVRRVTTKDVVLDKNGIESWLYMGKASEWSFDRTGATHYWIDHDGKQIPMIRIEYITEPN